MSDTYAGVTAEQLRTSLTGYWGVEFPDDLVVWDAGDYYKDPEITTDELVEVILSDPEFQIFVNKLLVKAITGKQYAALEGDDVRRFARKNISKVSKYNTRRESILNRVKEYRKEENRKVTAKKIREAKSVLKRAGVKV